MNTRKTFLLALAAMPLALAAQDRFATRNGHIRFFSSTPMENIEADNNKVTSVLDATTGAIEFAALIKAFQFEKALMQEHFNENYMDSNTYPKATFKGKVTGFGSAELKKPGSYPVQVNGDLTIHGVTRPHAGTATITVDAAGGLKAVSEFEVKPEDHRIEIPAVVREKIAQQLKISVDLTYTRM